MKQFQFEVKTENDLRREIARIKKFCVTGNHNNVAFQIFTQESVDDLKAVTSVIEELLPDAPYYGCQTFGNIFEGKLGRKKTLIVAIVLEYETSRAQQIIIDPTDAKCEFHTLSDLWDYCNKNDWVKAVELISSNQAAAKLGVGKPLKGRLREGVEVFGGIAADPDDINVEETCVFIKGKGVSDSMMIATLLGGDDLFVKCSYVSGWEPLGKTFEVTACSKQRIKELDGESAFSVYRKYLGMDPDEHFDEDVIMFPLLVDQGGVDCLRIPTVAKNHKDLDLIVDVEEGMRVSLAYGEKTNILNNVRSKLTDVATYVPDAMRIYSCAHRRTFWGDEKIDKETDLFEQVAPTIGFFTRGELLRVEDTLHFFNSTIVYALVREGEPEETPYCLDDLFEVEKHKSSFARRLMHYVTTISGELISQQHQRIISTLADTYYTLHVVDIERDSCTEIHTQETIHKILEKHKEKGAQFVLNASMKATVTHEYKDAVLEFVDLAKVKERLASQKMVSMDFVGEGCGWIKGSFITYDRSEEGEILKVLFVTQLINEEKMREEKLIKISRTDELTRLLNRHAYEEKMSELDPVLAQKDLVVVSLDLNGLKRVNDNLGHMAGDELIVGAAYCMSNTLGFYGDVFRTGGDEFMAFLYMDDSKMDVVLKDLEAIMAQWKGRYCDSISISYGYCFNREFPDLPVVELTKIADKKMYEAKSAYYIRTGINRRRS